MQEDEPHAIPFIKITEYKHEDEEPTVEFEISTEAIVMLQKMTEKKARNCVKDC